MSFRFPLYAKILLWFFLNLLLLTGIFYAFVRAQFRFGLDSVITGRAGERVQAVTEVIVAELRDAQRAEWDAVLKRFSEAYQVQFYLFRNDGGQAGGTSLMLPPQVSDKIVDRRMQPAGRPPMNESPPGQPQNQPRRPSFEGGLRPDGQRQDMLRPESGRAEFPRGEGQRPESFRPENQRMEGPRQDGARQNFSRQDQGPVPQPAQPNPSGSFAKFMLHTVEPPGYWVGVRLPVVDRQSRPATPVVLLIRSDSLRGGGLFVDYTPWIMVGASALLISVLFWLPLVFGITRSISQMTAATERIAEGQFDARVSARRRDELGSLAGAINRMAARLAGFVTGQKRFLGDTAHELCAPIARLQVAIGIMEQRADASQKAYVEDLREEIQHMSELVNELLSFSRASLRQKEIKLEPVNLAAIARRVAGRESDEPGKIQIEIPDGLHAFAEPELLSRALANLVRNALRHAGSAGPVRIAATPHQSGVTLSVTDSGPGVPAEALEQIFDPFFRLDESRTRDTGGVGLGLAIVKTCVEACQGTVSAKNREPSGLQVDIVLRAA